MKRILCLLLALGLCLGSAALASGEASENVAPADVPAEAEAPPEALPEAEELLPPAEDAAPAEAPILEEAPVPTDGAPIYTPVYSAQPGDVILFGSYEQDNDPENGPEPIAWIVLQREDDRLMLLSKFALDFRPKNDVRAEVTWADCSLRAWLNGAFLDAAFTAEELAQVETTHLRTDGWGGWSGGPETDDRIFLLERSEALSLEVFRSDYWRVARPTAYAKAQGAQRYLSKQMITEFGDDNYIWYEGDYVMSVILQQPDCIFWSLRDPGSGGTRTTSAVEAKGAVTDCGDYVDIPAGIRPAMWITAPADPYDADGDGEYTVRDAALLLPESPRMAAEVLLHVLSIRRLG